MAALRTFIAIALTDEVRDWIVRGIESLKGRTQGIRWTPLGQLHLTLRFLGDVPEERMPEVIDAVSAAASITLPFEVRPGGFGAFPDLRRPRVLWTGVDGDLESLCGHQARVEEELARRGFPREDRPFSPHLTLGRPGREGRVILPPDAGLERSGPAMLVRETLVVKSELRPGGAIHTPVSRARFREP
jgi:RNA 2',3'-cyclic 3'-phosphodiesterase